MSNLIGQRLGQYEILALIGKGGMATVYRARQTSIERDVAVKVIKSDLAETSEFIERFQREARTVASLNHAHILKVFDYGQLGDLVYLVMELHNGGNLTSRIGKGSLTLDAMSRILDQIASALDYAHRRGIVHRDLKPQNVLLDDDGNAVLTDFGIAKIVGETRGLTQSGTAIGTPAYMSPEQWRGDALDARADIYALGVMLFEMLTRSLPFDGETPFTIMHKHIYESPPSIRLLRADLPPGVEGVMNKALAKDREQRFSAAGELAAAFKAALAGSMPIEPESIKDAPTFVPSQLPVSSAPIIPAAVPTPTVPATPRRNRGLIGGLTAGVVIALVIGVLAALSSGNRTPTGIATTALATTPVDAVASNPSSTPTRQPGSTDTVAPSQTPLPAVVLPTATNTRIPLTSTFTATSRPSATAPRPTRTVAQPTTPALLTQTSAPTAVVVSGVDPTVFDMSGAALYKAPDGTFEFPLPKGWQTTINQGLYQFTYGKEGSGKYALLLVMIGDPKTVYNQVLRVSADSPQAALEQYKQPKGSGPTIKFGDVRAVKIGKWDGVGLAHTFVGTGAGTDRQAEIWIAPLPDGKVVLVGFAADQPLWDSAKPAFYKMVDGLVINAQTTANSTIPTVTANKQWQPVIQPLDGVEMALVPPGCFMMGNSRSNDNDAPATKICFDVPFWIDRYEVTNEQFKHFNGKAAHEGRWTDDKRPREYITWFEARDFCAVRGSRLPTESEWEYAARGPDNLFYPWSNDVGSDSLSNVVRRANANGQTAEVGSKPGGMSWVGSMDMLGNVWEWVSTLYKPYPYRADDGRENVSDTSSDRVIRGGSLNDELIYTTLRTKAAPSNSGHILGFRCARPYDSAPTMSATTPPTASTPVSAVPTVTANKQWKPVTQNFNGVEMALVPPGCFMMGSTDDEIAEQLKAWEKFANRAATDADKAFFNNQKPIGKQCFTAPFWIDKYEVTNEQFAKFGGQAQHASTWTDLKRPRDQITWLEARDFCATKRAMRLPTESEWEYAARGSDNLTYPWGNTFLVDNVVIALNSGARTADVGSKPGGVAWVGAYDLIGNLAEWISSLYKPYPYSAASENNNDTSSERIVRGGTWADPVSLVRSANRSRLNPYNRSSYIGFRCVRPFDGASGVSATAAPTTSASQAAVATQSAATQDASSFPFTLKVRGYALNPRKEGCNWQSIMGAVVDQKNQPIKGLAIHVTGGTDNIDATHYSGADSPDLGPSGFEIPLGIKPQQAKYIVQLLSKSGEPLSDQVTVETHATCDQNVVLVVFEQKRPY